MTTKNTAAQVTSVPFGDSFPAHTFSTEPTVGQDVTVATRARSFTGEYIGFELQNGEWLHGFVVTAASGQVNHWIPAAWFTN